MAKLVVCLLGIALLFSGCLSSGQAGKEPGWVTDPYKKYDRQTNVAAVGGGGSREAAEKNALGGLVAIFGRSIQVDEKVSLSYREAVKNGAIAKWSENTTVDTVVSSQMGMDSLVGAEIGEVWFNGKGEYWAVAALNKAKAVQVYSGMVKSSLTVIENLVNVPEAEFYTLDGFSRFRLAAVIADLTAGYANLLSFIGAPVNGLKSGDDYRLQALNIARAIPVGLNVRNDRSGRIEGAFAKALSDLGFRSGGSNSRYMLAVNVITVPVVISGNGNKFTRIELLANLADLNTGTVLLPYSFSDRQGHITQTEADNRAYAAAERRINEEYSGLFNDFLIGMLSKK
jgi:hypothetical protein